VPAGTTSLSQIALAEGCVMNITVFPAEKLPPQAEAGILK